MKQSPHSAGFLLLAQSLIRDVMLQDLSLNRKRRVINLLHGIKVDWVCNSAVLNAHGYD